MIWGVAATLCFLIGSEVERGVVTEHPTSGTAILVPTIYKAEMAVRRRQLNRAAVETKLGGMEIVLLGKPAPLTAATPQPQQVPSGEQLAATLTPRPQSSRPGTGR